MCNPGGLVRRLGKCAVAAGLVGATMGAIEESEAAAAGAVGGALIGGVLCAVLDVNEPVVEDLDSDGDGEHGVHTHQLSRWRQDAGSAIIRSPWYNMRTLV